MRIQPGMVIPFGVDSFTFTVTIEDKPFVCGVNFTSAVEAKQEMRKFVHVFRSESSEYAP